MLRVDATNESVDPTNSTTRRTRTWNRGRTATSLPIPTRRFDTVRMWDGCDHSTVTTGRNDCEGTCDTAKETVHGMGRTLQFFHDTNVGLDLQGRREISEGRRPTTCPKPKLDEAWTLEPRRPRTEDSNGKPQDVNGSLIPPVSGWRVVARDLSLLRKPRIYWRVVERQTLFLSGHAMRHGVASPPHPLASSRSWWLSHPTERLCIVVLHASCRHGRAPVARVGPSLVASQSKPGLPSRPPTVEYRPPL